MVGPEHVQSAAHAQAFGMQRVSEKRSTPLTRLGSYEGIVERSSTSTQIPGAQPSLIRVNRSSTRPRRAPSHANLAQEGEVAGQGHDQAQLTAHIPPRPTSKTSQTRLGEKISRSNSAAARSAGSGGEADSNRGMNGFHASILMGFAAFPNSTLNFGKNRLPPLALPSNSSRNPRHGSKHRRRIQVK